MASLTRREFLEQVSGVAATAAVGGAFASRPGRTLAAISPSPSSLEGARPRFCFLHTFEATGRYWGGLQQAGLVRPTTGVRLVHSPFGDDARRFNVVARVGGQLHGIIQAAKCPFVIDRVAGGSPYLAYDFDSRLIEMYGAMLGEKFLGGQVHETVCNVHNDWGRFLKANDKFAREPIRPQELKAYFTWDSAPRWLEYGTLEDYAGRVHPGSAKAWWKEIEWAARRQAARFSSFYSYCEGSHYGELAWPVFYRFGARYCLAEVGVWASRQSQFAIASLRGAAKADGRPWGVFFAPWGPGGCTSFVPVEDWSWQAPRKFLDDSGWPVGPDRGPSTALQRRILFHSYLSGAHTLHEEWGAEGNLTDWERGTLSSYGRVTRDLLDFQEEFPYVGEPYTPVALVLDADVPTPDPERWTKIRQGLCRYGPADEANAKRAGAGKEETSCYSPWMIPEVFDIVPSDAPDRVWSQYREVLAFDVGHAPKQAKTYPASEVLDRLIAVARKHSPFARSTHMPMQINRRAGDGAWIVALYNPWGAKRGDIENVGSILDDGCTIRDVLQATFPVRSARAIHAWPRGSAVQVKGDEIDVVVGAGGTLILEVLPKA